MNVDIFEKQQFTLQFLYSLLQVYIVHRVSFIFHLNVFQCPFVQEDSVICFADRGEGEQEQGMGNRFSFHEFYNFLLFSFVIIIIFLKTVFFPRQLPTPTTHTQDPHLRPTPTTHDLYPRPTTHDPRYLATLQINVQEKCAARAKFFFLANQTYYCLVTVLVAFTTYSITRCYIQFEHAKNIIESFAFSPG